MAAEETAMKPVRLTTHARLQCAERGTNQQEVEQAVREGACEPAKRDRMLCRFNFAFNSDWQDNHYAVKQVAPVTKEEADEIVVVTVYVFYF
jgi:predicted secreted protein